VPNNLYGWGRLDISAVVRGATVNRGLLTGRVTEPAGSPIPGARIAASHSPGSVAHLTVGADGSYGGYLAAATYTLTVAAAGHLTRTVVGVVINSELTTTENVTMPACVVTANSMSYAPHSPRVGEPVTFFGTVAAGTPPITYTWNLGDGSPEQVGNPITHTFPVQTGAQSYTVTLTIENICPRPAVLERPVTVWEFGCYLPMLFAAITAPPVQDSTHAGNASAIDYVTDRGGDTLYYPTTGDDHPSPAGNRQATDELVPLLDAAYRRWQSGAPAATQPTEATAQIEEPGAGPLAAGLVIAAGLAWWRKSGSRVAKSV